MRRFDLYRIVRGTNLADPQVWNDRFEDLDLRLAAREGDGELLSGAIDSLIGTALTRLDDTFQPLILEAESRLNSLGASFSAETLDNINMAQGSLTVLLTEATAQNYVYTDYVSLRSAAAPENQMLAQVVSFDRANRYLYLTVVQVEGSGQHAGWLIRVGTPPEAGHAARLDNPHQVTAAQVGAYTIAETAAAIDAAIDAAIAELPPISTALLKANNLADLTNVPNARSALGLGALALASEIGTGNFASNVRSTQAQAEAGTDNVVLMTPLRARQGHDAAAAAAAATAAHFRAATAGKMLAADKVFEAAAFVQLADAAPITFDMAAGFNFYVTIGASRTLAFPSNPKVGQSGYIDVTQPGGGNASLSFASGYTFPGGMAPTLDLGASRTTSLFYFVRSAGEVRITAAFKGVRAS